VQVATCKLRYAPIAATKVQRLMGVLRGLSVGEAISLLRVLPQRGARMLEGVILSAGANALNKGSRNVESLRITSLTADFGPMRKRIRAKSRGMAYVERNRTTHITCTIGE